MVGCQNVNNQSVLCCLKEKEKQKTPVIIEFNGLPGLGKTTVANALINELLNNGYKVVDRQYRSNRFQTTRRPFPELFNLNLYRRVVAYSKIIPPLGPKHKYVNWTNYYVWKYKSIIRRSNIDFAIVDEGIIQFFVSMAQAEKMPESVLVDKVVLKLKSLGISFVRVDCENHVEEACLRVMSRPARGLAFERMSKEELFQSMRNWAYNIDYLRSVFSRIYDNQLVIPIDTKDPVDYNVQMIYKKICDEL